VDADACPTVIRDILFRAAERVGIELTLVANQWIRTPPSRWLRSIQVPQGLDVADSAIVERVAAGDLVVTQDIPLAALVLEKKAVALNPRGQLYTPNNMAERLSMRNFMEELRGAGVQTGGPPPLGRATGSCSPPSWTAGWRGARFAERPTRPGRAGTGGAGC
jgi:uncharacterized protein YaiI (UPF0178 family)